MLLTCQWENESFNTGKTVMSYEICLQPWAHSTRNRIRGLTAKYQTCLFISSSCVKASTLSLLFLGLGFCYISLIHWQFSVDTKQSLLILLDGLNEINTVIVRIWVQICQKHREYTERELTAYIHIWEYFLIYYKKILNASLRMRVSFTCCHMDVLFYCYF